MAATTLLGNSSWQLELARVTPGETRLLAPRIRKLARGVRAGSSLGLGTLGVVPMSQCGCGAHGPAGDPSGKADKEAVPQGPRGTSRCCTEGHVAQALPSSRGTLGRSQALMAPWHLPHWPVPKCLSVLPARDSWEPSVQGPHLLGGWGLVVAVELVPVSGQEEPSGLRVSTPQRLVHGERRTWERQGPAGTLPMQMGMQGEG